MYLANIYDKPVKEGMAQRIIRVKLWEKGHSMDEIDAMDLEDIGDVLGYWSENSRIQAKQAQTRKNLRGKRRK